jgi:peptide/nickel transport system permease protein
MSVLSGQIAPDAPEAVSGIQLAQGIGVQEAKGFWADAWSQVLKRPGAIAALAWLAVVGFFAAFAPVLASGHPLVYRFQEDGREVVRHPYFENLTSGDAVIAIGTLIAIPWIFYRREGRAARLGAVIYGAVLAGIVVIGASFVQNRMDQREAAGWALDLRKMEHPAIPVTAALGVFALLLGIVLPAMGTWARRIGVPVVSVGLAAVCVVLTWTRPLPVFDYISHEVSGQATATYTLIPFSPAQRFSSADREPPGTKLGEALGIPEEKAPARRTFWLGTDAFGQDVLAGLMSASRLAISIGLVSTGIAVLIGVTMGALMGYFGGWVDIVLSRVLEVFMAIPVLFLLIVAAAVLPEELRTTYAMMAIIGFFNWTTAARFTRAEFLKMRGQDFVQSAKAVGLPLPAILFRHMLPNGVTPVLVDASFSIAAAIALEATLSYLGLGPVDQPSWGKLLASAMSAEGQFKWWLAVFPGAAIFLTILSYNLVGEALRDAIDPKLKKARV